MDCGGIPVRGRGGNLTGCFFEPLLTTAAAHPVHSALLYVREAEKIGLRTFSAVNVGPVVLPNSPGLKSKRGVNTYPLLSEVIRQAEALALALQPRLVVISPSVYQLVDDRFDCFGVYPLGLWGPHDELPGTLYVVEKEKVPTTWKDLLEESTGHLFGRRPEMEELRRAWESSQRRQGTLVHLVGSLGAGRSRLLQAFLRGLESETPRPTVVKLAGANYGSGPGYLLGVLARVCTQLRMETTAEAQRQLEGHLPRRKAARETLAARLITQLVGQRVASDRNR